MSTATYLPPPRIKPRSRLFTAADIERLPKRLDGMDVDYEIYNGELVVMAPPAAGHSRSQGSMFYYLKGEAELKGLGEAYDEVGVLLQRNPDTLVGADAAFVLKASLPVELSREGYLLTVPEIIVEVRSKNDSLPEVVSKCEQYLEAGSVLVWVPDPKHRTITEYRRDAGPRVFQPADTLVCDLLPGFAVPVRNFFDE